MRTLPPLRLLLVSTASLAAGALCLSVHLAVYSFDGEGWVLFEVLGQVFVSVGKAMLRLLQMLTVKDWLLFS